MKRCGIKCVFLAVLLLTGMLGLTGCKAGPLPLQEGEQAFQVYYLNSAMTRLVPQQYRTMTTDTDQLIDELMQSLMHVPADLDSQTALSDKVAYQGFKRMDNVLYLFFDMNYTSMQAEREILCRAALVKTLTQIPGVEYISIYSGEQPLLGTNDAPVGMMAAGDFVDSISDVNAYETTELTLYFADDAGEKLYPEKRMVIHNINTSVEKLVVEELIRGPEQQLLKPTLEPGTKLLNVSVNENVCYLNFDASFLNNSLEVRDYIPIYSIVNSISELSGMNRVQISVNGDKEVLFRESISLNTMFERNLDYIGGMEH
ncbi:MAG: GerMN domain-containing protein [Lachnospiraceae bacterium]|nr:GerMN domain-containing protein [Lachnospiraceae bacterium]